MIDSQTGLPLAAAGATPPELDTASQAAFVRGHNDEILRTVAVGDITRDFRRLLMTRKEVLEAFHDNTIGTLSLDCPRIEDPHGTFFFTLLLQMPKPRKSRKA